MLRYFPLIGLLAILLMVSIQIPVFADKLTLIQPATSDGPFWLGITKEVRRTNPSALWSKYSKPLGTTFGQVGREIPESFLSLLCRENGFENSDQALRRLKSKTWVIPIHPLSITPPSTLDTSLLEWRTEEGQLGLFLKKPSLVIEKRISEVIVNPTQNDSVTAIGHSPVATLPPTQTIIPKAEDKVTVITPTKTPTSVQTPAQVTKVLPAVKSVKVESLASKNARLRFWLATLLVALLLLSLLVIAIACLVYRKHLRLTDNPDPLIEGRLRQQIADLEQQVSSLVKERNSEREWYQDKISRLAVYAPARPEELLEVPIPFGLKARDPEQTYLYLWPADFNANQEPTSYRLPCRVAGGDLTEKVQGKKLRGHVANCVICQERLGVVVDPDAAVDDRSKREKVEQV